MLQNLSINMYRHMVLVEHTYYLLEGNGMSIIWICTTTFNRYYNAWVSWNISWYPLKMKYWISNDMIFFHILHWISSSHYTHSEPSVTYENRFLGSFLVGKEVTTCPHRSTPLPNRIHQSQSSRVSASVENARPPNWTITICTWEEKCVTMYRVSEVVLMPCYMVCALSS